MRLFFPILLVAAAIALFSLWTNPHYQNIKKLQAQVQAFDEALSKTDQLRERRDELVSKLNTFSTENRQKLERILPDNVDNIRFVIEINGIAARRNLTLKNIAVGDISDAKAARGPLALGPSGDPVGSAETNFSFTATYDEALAFLADLEHSLRVVDVEQLSIKPNTTGSAYDVSMTIRTYWLH